MHHYAVHLLACSTVLLASAQCQADIALLREHCAKCHTGPKPKGDFSLHELRAAADGENVEYWLRSLERVEADEMPPVEHDGLSEQEKHRLQAFLKQQITQYEQLVEQPNQSPPRRLNNREFENSLRDVLLLDNLGTHAPLAMLLGDTLHDGFDTHGETLGMSEYHLDQYVTAIRNVLDNVILAGEQPASQRYNASPQSLLAVDSSNRKRADRTSRRANGVDIRGPQQRVYCENFVSVPHTGRYRITVRAKAIDRHVYAQAETGIYDDDPLTLRMNMGSRFTDFDLQEGAVQEFESSHWLTEGTSLEFSHHTDGLRMQGNGNFKFQNRIAHDYIKANKPDLYQRVVSEEVPVAKTRSDAPNHWVHWVRYWQGPRPLLCRVTIEGPLFDSWPPRRQVALLGANPQVGDAAEILKPIAERAWRRPVPDEELAPIVALVESQATTLGDIAAFKEGILAVLLSPSFLMLNPENATPQDLFAAKFSYFLGSTSPEEKLIAQARAGQLESFEAVRHEIEARIHSGEADAFLGEFPYAWLQLDRINFMAPDVDRFPLYEKKSINEDMVNEVLAFFRHNVERNRPTTELLTADYSFVNADLARVYELQGVPADSAFRKYTFRTGRRGGFLGMGAFLTLTADTLSTSPIHRAVYVMENFMGIVPSPPPSDVEIREPDIRSARTIREVLEAHRSDATCSACHQNIDPFGYAFENFDPIGAWRDEYIDVSQAVEPPVFRADASTSERSPQKKGGKRKPKNQAIQIDASATFLSGARYKDVTEFRRLMQTDTNQNRFVRCFITKLLTYANGVEPQNFTEVEAIVKRAAEHDYKIVDTIAAVVDSPLFRETQRP